MRVGVIAAEMERRSTGVGRYIAGLLHGLTRWNHGAGWSLFFQGAPFDHPLFDEQAFDPVFSGFRGHPVLWEQAVLPWTLRNHDLDVLLAPAFTVPFGIGVPSAVVIHDLAYELLPEQFGWRERWRRRLLARRASRVAARVLTVSARVADELRRVYGVAGDRIGVVPNGVDVDLLGDTAGGAPDGGSGFEISSPYLLVMGTLLERRMPRLVLEAFARLADTRPDLQLVLAGDNRLRQPARLDGWISELGLADRVQVLGWVEDRFLPGLYGGAELSLYLSSYEGFGIPPLESLAFRTPAVVGAVPALDELWSEYPYRVTSPAVSEIVETCRRILDDPAEVETVIDEAQRVLARASWEHSSRRLVDELGRTVAP
jgi:alpha-1,3-rhamnosyl/mannosyltransferase